MTFPAKFRGTLKETIQSVLKSGLAWRVSGFTYPTAVYATKGRFLAVTPYLSYCQAENAKTIPEHVFDRKCRALEFGCGLGGHLIALGHRLDAGVGVDVNRGYLRLARRLAQTRGLTNLTFLDYDGTHLPEVGKFDLILSVNVFERIPKHSVQQYISWMRSCLRPRGVMVLSFLHERAAKSSFVSLLGDQAYVYWTSEEVQETLAAAGFDIDDAFDWGRAAFLVIASAE